MAILPIDGKRYGTPEMLAIFAEQKKIDYQLQIEGAVAISQAHLNIIPKVAGRAILSASRSGKITIARVKKIESKTDHDTAALVQALSEHCSKLARPWIHYGLTSNDLVDTSNSLQMRDALNIIEPKMKALARSLASMAVKYAKLPAVGRTHGQHASIIAFGLKFANWAEETVINLERINQMRSRTLICKTLGVVGTGSLMGDNSIAVQKLTAKRLGLKPAHVATQVVPRERYAEFVFSLALAGTTLDKMAVEIRNLQRTEIGEVAEYFAKGQMGSSAVPVKRNPIKSERVSSLARVLRSQVGISLENISLWHERDLTNSANERFLIPTVIILYDEMLHTMLRILKGLKVNTKRIRENLYITKGQIFAEFVLEALIKKGIPRIDAYRDVQRVAFKAVESRTNYLDALKADKAISSNLTSRELDVIFDPEKRLGASNRIVRNVVASTMRAIGKKI
ncbi:MAG: adenylosuccinate lyase [Cenarchaeum symbiont of Oopsacas minuta]|nr:adenylosuccinate lyase [Cenarchaeum symbiont of Oopsacas minuta]